MTICGICHYNSDNSTTTRSFYCPSCVQFRMLKFNLNKINILNISSQNIRNINIVLSQCLNDKSEVFLKKYIAGEYKEEKLNGTNVNIDSVARLAFMLMNVEMNMKQVYMQDIEKMVISRRKENGKLEDQIRMLKEKKERMQNALDKMNKQDMKIEVTNDKMLERLEKVVNNERVFMIRKIISLWNIKILGNSVSLLFTKVVTIEKIKNFRLGYIMNMFVKICGFIDTISTIIDVYLPFETGIEANELRIGDKMYRFKDTEVSELSEVGKRELSIGIARIISDLMVVLGHVGGFVTEPLAYDEMLVQIVKNMDHPSPFTVSFASTSSTSTIEELAVRARAFL